MTIKRYPGKAFGRSKSVEHNGIVYTVVIAPDVSADFKGQTQQVLEQLDANLAEAGTDKSCLLSVTIYITDMSKKPILNEVWDAWIGPYNWPQRACVEVKLEGDTLVEMVVIAAK
ncbi:MAG: RidA family protein [Gemmatimonadetes bacterium]|nr:RidA family protein [Gemmatimonadota bacterium]MYK51529.1 RidA family protein [Gemmatimonadota bacterium]